MRAPRPSPGASTRRASGRPATTDAPEAEDDGAEETGPLRRCAVTRERLAKDVMVRFVVAPDRTIVPDLAARLPGRGIWLSARADVIETACTRGAFARAARAQVVVPPDLASVLQAALARRVGEHLGFARRAGQAVAGYQKAREWLESGRAALVVQAADGSPDERARFLAGWTGRVCVVEPLDAQGLGAVFGRERAVHVAVASGRLAEGIKREAQRLAGLRSTVVITKGKRSRVPVGGGRGHGIAGGALPQADASQGG